MGQQRHLPRRAGGRRGRGLDVPQQLQRGEHLRSGPDFAREELQPGEPQCPGRNGHGDRRLEPLDGNGKRHMGYKIEGRIMGWSPHAYDDFIIIKCKLTSTDTDTLKNFYYARYVTPERPPTAPSSVSSGWAKNTCGIPAVSDTLGLHLLRRHIAPSHGPGPGLHDPSGGFHAATPAIPATSGRRGPATSSSIPPACTRTRSSPTP